MKTKDYFLVFTIFLFIFPISYAQDIDEFSVILDVTERISRADYSIVLDEYEGELSVPLFDETDSVVVYDKKTKQEMDFEISGNNIIMDIAAQERRIIAITAYFSDTISESDSKMVIQLVQPFMENTNIFDFTIKLPQGHVVSELDGKALAVPEPDNILSDGKHIILNWKEDNPEENFEVIVTYEPVQQGIPLTYIFFTLLIIVGGGLLILSILLKSRIREKRIVTVGLSEDEKRIYDFINEKGEVNQKEVQRELGFSKPRLSKLVRNLDQAGMIEKRPLGRTNILKIKKL